MLSLTASNAKGLGIFIYGTRVALVIADYALGLVSQALLVNNGNKIQSERKTQDKHATVATMTPYVFK